MSETNFATEIKEILLKANEVALTVHVHPDGDALGSMLAMYEVLKQLGINATMVIDDVIPTKFQTLPNADRILTVKELPKDKKIDCLVILDASTIDRIGLVAEAINAPKLNIDHHVSNSRFAEYLWLDPKAAATGEMLVELFTAWEIEITPTIANALYIAIATDCGFFKFSNTKEKTLLAAAKCVKYGANPQYVSNLVELTKPDRLLAIQKALETVKYVANGKGAFMAVDYKVMQLVNDDTDGFVDLIRNVDGVDIAVLFKQYSSKQTRVSFRSKETDVNELAAHFNGGGHVKAAGCTIKLPLEEAMAEVESLLNKVLGE